MVTNDRLRSHGVILVSGRCAGYVAWRRHAFAQASINIVAPPGVHTRTAFQRWRKSLSIKTLPCKGTSNRSAHGKPVFGDARKAVTHARSTAATHKLFRWAFLACDGYYYIDIFDRVRLHAALLRDGGLCGVAVQKVLRVCAAASVAIAFVKREANALLLSDGEQSQTGWR